MLNLLKKKLLHKRNVNIYNEQIALIVMLYNSVILCLTISLFFCIIQCAHSMLTVYHVTQFTTESGSAGLVTALFPQVINKYLIGGNIVTSSFHVAIASNT